MSDYKQVPPSAGQEVATKFDKDIVVIVSIDWAHDKTHFTSFGKSAADKLNAAKLSEAVAKAVLENPDPKQWFHDFRTHGGAGLIAGERARQISGEGYTAEHDDKHALGELPDAAAAYAKVASAQMRGASAEEFPAFMMTFEGEWPWEEEAWKPSDDPIKNLVKAGALIAAEIDRLLRAKK